MDVSSLTAKLKRLPPQTTKQKKREATCIARWKRLLLQHRAAHAKHIGKYMSIVDSGDVWYAMAVNIKHVKHRLIGIRSKLRKIAISDVDQIQPWSGGATPAKSQLQGSETTPARSAKVPSFPSTERVSLKSKLVRKQIRDSTSDEERMKAMLPALTTGSSGNISWNSWSKSAQKLTESK